MEQRSTDSTELVDPVRCHQHYRDVERWEQLRREADELFERTVALQDRFAAADRALKANDTDLKAAIAHGGSRRAWDLNMAAQALRLEFVGAQTAAQSGALRDSS